MKLQKAAICAILSIFAVSCSQVEVDTGTIETVNSVEYFGNDIIHAYADQPAAATRTSLLADSTTVVWSSGDKFDIVSSDGQKNTFGLISGAGEQDASFSGTVSGSEPYYAVYPASDDISINDGVLNFKLPKNQTYKANSFGLDASPAIAKTYNVSDGLYFKNLCGLLCLNLQGSSMSVKKIVLHDLAGNMLWGDAKLTLKDAGTDYQQMELTGGDNKLTLEMSSAVTLLPATPKKFYFVVPQGTLDHGFEAVIYDASGAVIDVIQTQNPAVAVERSHTSNMVPLKLTGTRTEYSEVARRGYYNDIFMDGGCHLTSRNSLPAATTLLGWTMEYFASEATANLKEIDTTMQTAVFVGDENDPNGALLYPDGEPRYRCIYVNGGKSTNHGKSLGAKGRQSIYDFVYAGGGYVGTCAGALIACQGYDSYKTYSYYLHIYPGHTYHTGMNDTHTDLTVVSGCPLLKYSDFGGDNVIASVIHNGGCYCSTSTEYWVSGAEKLLTYSNCPSGHTDNNGRVACWAYKPSKEAGRMVLIGSHPEGAESGEKRDLMGAMLRYAVDGGGTVSTKATLTKGTKLSFTSKSGTKAGIGDKQYHHFKVEIPAGAKNIKVNLTSTTTQSDLYLSLNKKSLAYFSDADYALTQEGGEKTLDIKNLDAGTWYVSVYCASTPTAKKKGYITGAAYYQYTGNVEVLKGVPYTLSVDWE